VNIALVADECERGQSDQSETWMFRGAWDMTRMVVVQGADVGVWEGAG